MTPFWTSGVGPLNTDLPRRSRSEELRFRRANRSLSTPLLEFHLRSPVSEALGFVCAGYEIAGPLHKGETPMLEEQREWVAKRAYELWEKRGRPFGSSDEDWFEALREFQEQELRERCDSPPLSACSFEAIES